MVTAFPDGGLSPPFKLGSGEMVSLLPHSPAVRESKFLGPLLFIVRLVFIVTREKTSLREKHEDIVYTGAHLTGLDLGLDSRASDNLEITGNFFISFFHQCWGSAPGS